MCLTDYDNELLKQWYGEVRAAFHGADKTGAFDMADWRLSRIYREPDVHER